MKKWKQPMSWKKFASRGLATVLCLSMLTVTPVSAETGENLTEGEVLYQDDFEAESLNSRWNIPEGTYQLAKEETDSQMLHISPNMQSGWEVRATYVADNPDEWQDYSIEMDFLFKDRLQVGVDYPRPSWGDPTPYDNIAIMGRCSGTDSWGVYYRVGSKTLELNKMYNNAGIAHKTASFDLKENQMYRLKIEFDGPRIAAYIVEKGQEFGEMPIVEVRDEGLNGPTYTSGSWAISTGGCAVAVDSVKVTGLLKTIPLEELAINRNSLTLAKGESEELSVQYKPANASCKEITWTSGDEMVALVSDEGQITATGTGSTTIVVSSVENPEIKAECRVTVYEALPCETFYYVSPMGDDKNDGSIESPFRTLERARDVIREREIPEGGITVYLRDGIYELEDTFVLTPEDSGKLGSPIVYTSYPGEQAVISGGKSITGWTLVSDDTPQLAEEAKGRVYVADIEKGWRFHDLYVDGMRMNPSTNCDGQDWTEWPSFKTNGFEKPSPEGMKVNFRDGELDGLSGKDIEVNVITVPWWNGLPVVKDIDENASQAWLHSKNPTLWTADYFYNSGNYEILNAFKYLDTPGEWCVDSEEGKVYFWPLENNLDEVSVIAPKPYELIRFQGDEEEQDWAKQVEYVELRNLVFEYNDRMPEDLWPEDWLMRNAENPDAAIFMQGVKGCRIEDSVIRHTGSYAVALDHWAQENVISGNELGDLGCGGVQIYGYGPGVVDVNYGNKVVYNYIHDVGLAPYMHSSAVTIYGSGENVISHNKMVNMPYTAVAICGTMFNELNNPANSAYSDTYGKIGSQYNIRWEELGGKIFTRESAKEYLHSDNNIVEYNIIEEYMLRMNDGGALYAWATGLGNEFNYNLVKKTTPAKHMTWPLYMDDEVDGAKLEGNVIWGIYNQQLNKGDNEYINNEFSDMETKNYRTLQQQIRVEVNESQGGYKQETEITYLSVWKELLELYEANKDKKQETYTEGSWILFKEALLSAEEALENKGNRAEAVNALNFLESSIRGLAEGERPAQEYDVTIDKGIQHGIITANPVSAQAGTRISLIVNAEEGYGFIEGSLKVMTISGKVVTVEDSSFVMPEEDVTVTAEFEKTSPNDPGEIPEEPVGDSGESGGNQGRPDKEESYVPGKTGDEINLLLPVLLMCLAAAGVGLVAVAATRKKRGDI